MCLKRNGMWTLNNSFHKKGISYGVFYIYINLGILQLCTEIWNNTSSKGKAWQMANNKCLWLYAKVS